MSNRRRLPSEKAKRVRCPKCRCTDLQAKVWTGGERHLICQACDHVWREVVE